MLYQLSYASGPVSSRTKSKRKIDSAPGLSRRAADRRLGDRVPTTSEKAAERSGP